MFKLYAEHIVKNAGLDELQAGVKIGGRNINNLRYVDDTTPMAESKETQKSLLMTVKEESERAGLKLNIKKTKTMASGPITSWQIQLKVVTDTLFLGYKITVDGDCSHEIRRQNASWQESHDKPRQYVEKQRHNSANKGPYNQGMVFSVVTDGFKSRTVKKAEHQRIDALEL